MTPIYRGFGSVDQTVSVGDMSAVAVGVAKGSVPRRCPVLHDVAARIRPHLDQNLLLSTL
jgi:hypothetical protein